MTAHRLFQRRRDARLADADLLLFHGLVHGGLVVLFHLVHLVDEGHALSASTKAPASRLHCPSPNSSRTAVAVRPAALLPFPLV